MSLRSRQRSAGPGVPRIPPPPQFKPPPLPEEDDDVFIRPITRTRSPVQPQPVGGNLTPVLEVDTPESSRSVSPNSMASLSRYSSSPRNISPAPFVVSHDTFIKGSAPNPEKSTGSTLQPSSHVPTDDTAPPPAKVSKHDPELSKTMKPEPFSVKTSEPKPYATKVLESKNSLPKISESKPSSLKVLESRHTVPKISGPKTSAAKITEPMTVPKAAEPKPFASIVSETKPTGSKVSESKTSAAKTSEPMASLPKTSEPEISSAKDPEPKPFSSNVAEPKQSKPKHIESSTNISDITAEQFIPNDANVIPPALKITKTNSSASKDADKDINISQPPVKTLPPTKASLSSTASVEEILIPCMQVEPPTPPVIRSALKPNTPSMSANEQKRVGQHKIDSCDEPQPKTSKFENDELENISMEDRFPEQDEKHTPSKFKRRQSKKIQPRKDLDTSLMETESRVEPVIELADELTNLENKNLTEKERHVIAEVLTSRRSRSRSNSRMSVSPIPADLNDDGHLSELSTHSEQKHDILACKDVSLQRSSQLEFQEVKIEDVTILRSASGQESPPRSKQEKDKMNEKKKNNVLKSENIKSILTNQNDEVEQMEEGESLKVEIINQVGKSDNHAEATKSSLNHPVPPIINVTEMNAIQEVQFEAGKKKGNEDKEPILKPVVAIPDFVENIADLTVEQLKEHLEKEELTNEALKKDLRTMKKEVEIIENIVKKTIEEEIKSNKKLEAGGSKNKNEQRSVSPATSGNNSNKKVEGKLIQTNPASHTKVLEQEKFAERKQPINSYDTKLQNSLKSGQNSGKLIEENVGKCSQVQKYSVNSQLKHDKNVTNSDKQGNEQGGPRSRQADKMEQIQQFLKDPQNPRGKVEIKVRLKNSGSEMIEVAPGLLVTSGSSLTVENLEKFDLVLVSAASNRVVKIPSASNLVEIKSGNEICEVAQALDKHGQSGGRILVCGEGGDPPALAAAIISRRNRVSLQTGADIIRKGNPGIKINQALILRMMDNEKEDRGLGRWRTFLLCIFLAAVGSYFYQALFTRLEDEHKRSEGEKDDYSYFNILKWP